jgi:hypothetical protein
MRSLLLIALLLQTAALANHKISGRVTTFRGTPPPQTLTLRVYGQSGPGGSVVTRSIPVRSDSTFEVTGIAPGEFSISLGNPFQSPIRGFTFREGDVTDFEMKVPVAVSGRVVMSDGQPYNGAEILLTLTTDASATNIGRAPKMMKSLSTSDGPARFSLLVFPGDNAITVSGVPAGYAVQSIRYDGQDVPQSGLKLDTAPTSAIVVTLVRS